MNDDAPAFSAALLRNGLSLHYAACGDPEGSPMLFLHGWPDSWYSFSRVLPRLPRSYYALAIDQRGFGDSDRPDSGYSVPEMAQDVLVFLDRLGIGRVLLVGHSFGSFVARQVAIAEPSRVEALVLIGTGLTPRNAVTLEVQAALRSLPDPIPEEFAREFQSGTIHHPVPEDFFDQIIRESLKLPPRLWRLLFDELLEYDDRQQLGAIEAPTLLLWGDHDALFPREDQERLLAVLPSARLTVEEDTGHCPNWERPERVAAAIAGFASSR